MRPKGGPRPETGSILVELRSTVGVAAPTELRIFQAGENDSTQGTFLFDAKAAKSVMAAAAKRGVDFPFDFNHGSTSPLGMLNPEMSGKAAGWCSLEVRDGALWAVNIRWTENALAAIEAKEWRYISPTFEADKEKRVTSILAIALTNTPALHNLEPLVAASANTEELSMDGWVPMCLGRSCSSTSLCCQACACKVMCASLCYGQAVPPDPATEMSATALQSSARESGAAWEKSVADKAINASKELHMKNVLTALSLAETASEADAVVALTALRSQIAALTTEKTTLSAQAVELAAKVTTLEQAASVAEVTALIDQGKREHKITPALESVVKTFSLSQIKDFLKAASPVVDGKPVKEKEGVDEVVALSADEAKNLTKVHGITADAYLKHKAELQKRGLIS